MHEGKPTIHQLHLDKVGKVSDKWESYLSFYDREFAPFRHQRINLLEIGVQNGGSLETWAAYFEHATAIVGMDIDPRCGELRFSDPRILVVVGDASRCDTNAEFDIIIDDGSHTSDHIIANFNRWWPRLRPGGLYVVEDFHTMWMTGYGSEAVPFFANMITALNMPANESPDVCRLEFRNSLVLLQKGDSALGKRLVCGSTADVNPALLALRKNA
jgi:hypothetical protein